MSIWKDCKASILYFSKDAAAENEPCTVKITQEAILVEYIDEDDGLIQYKGKNNGDGHFQLVSEKVRGRATLHRFAESTLLEGSWVEDGERGMWKIDLA